METFSIQKVFEPGQSNRGVLEIIKKLDKQIFPNDEPYGMYHLYYWWIAFNTKGEPVGFAGLDRMRGKNGYVCRCGVLGRWRGYGLQKRFLKARERYAKRLGLPRLLTYTTLTSFGSINSLTRSGYKIYRPKEYDKNWIFFRKDFD